MASATVETTVRSTFNDVRLIELPRSTRTVHPGVGHETDD